MRAAAGYLDRHYRLTNEPGGLGLSCTSAGASFAGVPLLRKVESGFAPRPLAEIETLIQAACGENIDAVVLSRGLGAIAHALNRGDVAFAMTAAVLTQLPELSWDSAARLAKVDEWLEKYDPDEPRDSHGRWTTGGAAGHPKEATPSPDVVGGEENQNGATPIPEPQKVLDLGFTPRSADDLPAPLTVQETEVFESPFADLEKKYDSLGPVELADKAIRFGEYLEGHGKELSPEDRSSALREYEFLQSRLTFWRGTYDGEMPLEAIPNLNSAALNLFQGGILSGIVPLPAHYTDFPYSYMAAAGDAPPAGDSSGIGGRHAPAEEDFSGEATALGQGRGQRQSTPEGDEQTTNREGISSEENESRPDVGDNSSELASRTTEPDAFAPANDSHNGLGGVVTAEEAGINWNGGIEEQGLRPEEYVTKNTPGAEQLAPGSKTWDVSVEATGEAISVKTLNPLCYSYASKPQSVYWKLKRYIDAATNYKTGSRFGDLSDNNIGSRTLHLFIRDYTSPAQREYLQKAIEYGKSRGKPVSVIITRVKDE